MPLTIVHPTSAVKAVITLPVSKSISNRALILQKLAGGGTIATLSDCDDTNILHQNLEHPTTTIDIGASGTAMRFLTAILAAQPATTAILTGTQRMLQRPIAPLVQALRECGADIDYIGEEGYPPIQIKGKKLIGGEIRIRGDISSQFASALILVAPTMQQGLQMTLIPPIVSMPYIKMTVLMMQAYGIPVTINENTIKIPNKEYKKITYTPERDWSAASYWYETLALAKSGEITLPQLTENSIQGDKMVVELFAMLGVKTTYTATGIKLEKIPVSTQYIDIDLRNNPDLVQTLVVTCCLLGVKFRFAGVGNLRIKETDRLNALKSEMSKLGYRLEVKNDVIAWDGRQDGTEHEIVINPYDDHRMAMAFAPVALCRPLKMEHSEVVSKSYPAFWEDMRRVGFLLS